MRIEFTSHYRELELFAGATGCYLMSVQNARIFFNFNSVHDAEQFIEGIQPLVDERLYVNTQRGNGLIPAEVSVPHKQWIY